MKLSGMAQQERMSDSQPRFEARPAGLMGDGWCVHVFWGAKEPKVIPGFRNQYEALNWIKAKSANWVADNIIQNPKY
jgi:hypothetical protein